MYEILLVIHIVIAVLLVGLILIQHGKGAQAGAAFGSGASQTVFGSQGSGGFLTQSTWVLAGLFFLTSIILTYLINKTTYQALTPVTQSEPTTPTPNQPKGEVPEIP